MIGDIYGDFKITKYTDAKNGGGGVICEAECVICGTKKYTTEYEFKRSSFKHSSLNCRECVINEEIGKVYGDLTVLKYVGMRSKCLIYTLKCNKCGRERDRFIKDVKRGIGISHKNCVESLPKNNTTKILRNRWSHMVDRCTNERSTHYKSYGGRGIKCHYDLFIDFYDDFYESYMEHSEKYGADNTTIDRINVNNDYIKDNMRWATWAIQHKNKRKTIVEAINGDIIYKGSIKEVSQMISCDKSCISDCINGKMETIKGFKIKVTEKPLTTIP